MERAWARTAALGLAFAASACGYGSDDPDDVVIVDSQCGAIREATIDTNAEQPVVEPGVGAGLFVEYWEGGLWRLFTVCDTLTSGFVCDWDVIVTALDGSELRAAAEENLEVDDEIFRRSFDSYRYLAFTSDDFDGFTFDSDPGVAVRVDALLDGECANPYMFWTGNGARHDMGSPSNPLDLVPSAP